MCKILIVDDSPLITDSLELIFELEGYQPSAVASVAECMMAVKKCQFDVIILDINLGDQSGTDLLGFIQKISPKTEVFIISGLLTDRLRSVCVEPNVAGYFEKPLNIEILLREIRDSIDRQKQD